MIASQQLVGGTPPPAPPTPAVRFARWGGVVLASAGIVGLALTGLTDLTSTTGARLWVFEVNALQNLLHLLVGGVLVVVSAASATTARTVVATTAAAFGVTGLLGLALVGTEANVLALNHAANAAHLVVAVLAALSVAASSRRRRP